jgi:spore coat polysaccharide biosynthesis protein SpsF
MDMQVEGKIGFIIQARMKSERLPGKVLLPLPFPDGETILGHVIQNLGQLEGRTIVATSRNSENEAIEEFCKKNEVEVYRGNEDDVLSRFLEIQDLHNFRYIVRLTADNPFIDHKVVHQALNHLIVNNLDYVSTKGLPIGMNVEVMRADALIESGKLVKTVQEREHVTLVLKNNEVFRKEEISFKGCFNHIRVTVDSVQDFLVACIVSSLQRATGFTGLFLIDYCIKHHPWVFKGNKDVLQKNSVQAYDDEIRSAINVLESLEYGQTVSLLKKQIS